MLLAIPKFQFRFVPALGHVIHPGNFHPVGTRRAAERMIERVATKVDPGAGGRWLIVGASGGFGSAARMVLGARRGAHTLGVSLDAQPNPESSNKIRKIGSPGFHRNAAIEAGLRARGLVARSLDGDAFDPGLRTRVIDEIRAHFDGKIDGVIWALATPRAIDPRTGNAVNSALRPLGNAVRIKTFSGKDGETGPQVAEVELTPGSPEEAISTIFVMGGDIVAKWVEALLDADVLAEGATVLTISYRGCALNEAVYRKGLIGLAKADLEFETRAIDRVLKERVDGRAITVEGPAVVPWANPAGIRPSGAGQAAASSPVATCAATSRRARSRIRSRTHARSVASASRARSASRAPAAPPATSKLSHRAIRSTVISRAQRSAAPIHVASPRSRPATARA
jgi:enoyl-[acyl-carrier protein] reductase/trans-2-enoyl-CoA reductase (NAD+)